MAKSSIDRMNEDLNRDPFIALVTPILLRGKDGKSEWTIRFENDDYGYSLSGEFTRNQIYDIAEALIREQGDLK